jgi:hypothetical protein
MSAPLCVGCGKRPALTHYTDKRGIEVHRALKDHELCRECRRSDVDRARQRGLPDGTRIRARAGDFEIPDVYSPTYRPPLRRSDSGENYVTGIRANEKGEVTSLALGVGGSKAGR